MSTRKIEWIIFSACSVIFLLLIFGKEPQVSKNFDNPPLGEKSDFVAQIQEYSKSSAITQAKELSGQGSDFIFLREEALQFGLVLLSGEENKYKQFRDRLLANDRLALALRVTSQEGIFVTLEHKFQVNTTSIMINMDASNEEIITFLTLHTPEAKARKAFFEVLRFEAAQLFGSTLMLWEENEYKQIRNRFLANEQLASALKTPVREGVQITFGHNFLILANAVEINVDASDQEIIEFLLGK